MRTLKLSLTLFAALSMNGCSSWQQRTTSQPDLPGTAEQQQTSLMLIANDFVNALRQLEELPPSTSTVHLLQANDDDFTRALEKSLQLSGYGIRRVGDGGGQYLLQFRHADEATSDGSKRDLYEIAVGPIELRRTYLTTPGLALSPVTPLYIRGADASRVALNDEAFLSQADQRAAISSGMDDRTAADKLASNTAEAQTQPLPLKPELEKRQLAPTTNALQSSSPLAVPPDANPISTLASNSGNANRLSWPLVALPSVENVFELGGSNYSDALSNHQIVAERILTFANDSLYLGSVNKSFIGQMVKKFDAQTDVFSVIGCSLGPTQLKSGNAALALGRAGRVKEALLFAGVPESNILDEGCWAGDSGNISMPRRGVVVTLNRKK